MKTIKTNMKTEKVITDFTYAKKEHWRSAKIHGSRTACMRKTSGVGANSTEEFEYWANKAPEICCSKCLLKYNEYKQK
jgi:hypothetical protein